MGKCSKLTIFIAYLQFSQRLVQFTNESQLSKSGSSIFSENDAFANPMSPVSRIFHEIVTKRRLFIQHYIKFDQTFENAAACCRFYEEQTRSAMMDKIRAPKITVHVRKKAIFTDLLNYSVGLYRFILPLYKRYKTYTVPSGFLKRHGMKIFI